MSEKERIYLSVKVRPQARQRKVEKISPSEYKVSVISPPSRGKANREAVETLASYFDLAPSRIKILKGEKARKKLIILEVDRKTIRKHFIFGDKDIVSK